MTQQENFGLPGIKEIMMITLRTVMKFRAWGEKEEASHHPRWKEHFKTSKEPKPTYYTSIRMAIPSSNRMANIITQDGEHVIHLNVVQLCR